MSPAANTPGTFVFLNLSTFILPSISYKSSCSANFVLGVEPISTNKPSTFNSSFVFNFTASKNLPPFNSLTSDSNLNSIFEFSEACFTHAGSALKNLSFL